MTPEHRLEESHTAFPQHGSAASGGLSRDGIGGDARASGRHFSGSGDTAPATRRSASGIGAPARRSGRDHSAIGLTARGSGRDCLGIRDYIPQSYKNFRDWLTKQNTGLTAPLATTIGMTAGERTAYLGVVGVLLPAASGIVDLMEQLEQATGDFQPLLDAQLPHIRAAIKRAKTSPGCTPSIQLELDWVGADSSVNPDTARPTINVVAQNGRVKIEGRKPGFEAVNIYSRKKGELPWKLIAVRKRKFPYYDETPLTVPGTPEVREYMAIGVIADEESGVHSEIVEVVFAG